MHVYICKICISMLLKNSTNTDMYVVKCLSPFQVPLTSSASSQSQLLQKKVLTAWGRNFRIFCYALICVVITYYNVH